jgi:hypothetical protein
LRHLISTSLFIFITIQSKCPVFWNIKKNCRYSHHCRTWKWFLICSPHCCSSDWVTLI